MADPLTFIGAVAMTVAGLAVQSNSATRQESAARKAAEKSEQAAQRQIDSQTQAANKQSQRVFNPQDLLGAIAGRGGVGNTTLTGSQGVSRDQFTLGKSQLLGQ